MWPSSTSTLRAAAKRSRRHPEGGIVFAIAFATMTVILPA
jgi:hypothetical protein